MALGAIAALGVVAGESSLIGTEDYKQPLVQALEFSNRVVRIRAALALGNALPRSPFAGSQWVIPVLADALRVTGAERFVVVAAESQSRNRVADELRQGGAEVIAEASFPQAMDRVRRQWHEVSAFFISTDPGLEQLRAAVQTLGGEFTYTRTPIILLTEGPNAQALEQLTTDAGNIGRADAGAGGSELLELVGEIRTRTGLAVLDDTLVLELALEAASTLRRLALDGRTVFDYAAAEGALISALGGDDQELRTRCASVLALIGTTGAQGSLADAGVARVLGLHLQRLGCRQGQRDLSGQ